MQIICKQQSLDTLTFYLENSFVVSACRVMGYGSEMVAVNHPKNHKIVVLIWRYNRYTGIFSKNLPRTTQTRPQDHNGNLKLPQYNHSISRPELFQERPKIADKTYISW